jgi:NADPH:quinone reductase-like Zn-dependent oxidoreductase
MRTSTTKITETMKAWRLDRLGGELRFESVPMPEIRPGSILVPVEASTLMSYMKSYSAAGSSSWEAWRSISRSPTCS